MATSQLPHPDRRPSDSTARSLCLKLDISRQKTQSLKALNLGHPDPPQPPQPPHILLQSMGSIQQVQTNNGTEQLAKLCGGLSVKEKGSSLSRSIPSPHSLQIGTPVIDSPPPRLRVNKSPLPRGTPLVRTPQGVKAVLGRTAKSFNEKDTYNAPAKLSPDSSFIQRVEVVKKDVLTHNDLYENQCTVSGTGIQNNEAGMKYTSHIPGSACTPSKMFGYEKENFKSEDLIKEAVQNFCSGSTPSCNKDSKNSQSGQRPIAPRTVNNIWSGTREPKSYHNIQTSSPSLFPLHPKLLEPLATNTSIPPPLLMQQHPPSTTSPTNPQHTSPTQRVVEVSREALQLVSSNHMASTPDRACSCARPQKLVMCCGCGDANPGRMRRKCWVHPSKIFLMDFDSCSKCMSMNLQEIDVDA